MNVSVQQKKCFSSCLLSGLLFSANAYSAGSFNDALSQGTANIDMRLRYESVDDSTNKNAEAATLRTRLGYTTADYNGLSLFGEFEDVRIVGGVDDYAPVTAGYATVADPEVTQLNQALLAYKTDTTHIKAGRQRLILDNARFIGNVGWRQNEQTFDAFSLVNTFLPDTTITYAFLDQVNGILTKFDADVSDHLLNLSYTGIKPIKITAYAYLLKDDGTDAKNDTYGVRLNGKADSFLYTAEFASQSTDNNDATYLFAQAGMRFSGITAKLGYEVLGSDNGAYGFQTPLATKHAFNGWADQFLATPATGLKDLMLLVTGKAAGVKLLAAYHDFSADEGSADYGSEVDLLAAKKFDKRYTLGIKYAAYSADTFKTDTDKLWVWGQVKI